MLTRKVARLLGAGRGVGHAERVAGSTAGAKLQEKLGVAEEMERSRKQMGPLEEAAVNDCRRDAQLHSTKRARRGDDQLDLTARQDHERGFSPESVRRVLACTN